MLLGSTAFDSYSASPTWRNFADRLSRLAHDVPATLSSSVLRTAGLLIFISVVALTFSLAARATGGVDRAQRRALPGQMAHSLIPIVVGYIFAHYLSYLVERGQQAAIALADPFGRGWNLLGLAHAHVAYVLSAHPPVLAGIKVGCVVTGHIVAVIAAHDKALRLLPAGHQLTGQLTMMLVMVGLHLHRPVPAIRRLEQVLDALVAVPAAQPGEPAVDLGWPTCDAAARAPAARRRHGGPA